MLRFEGQCLCENYYFPLEKTHAVKYIYIKKNDDGFYGQIRPSSLFPDTLRLHSNDKNEPKYYDLEFDFLSKTSRIKKK